MEFTSPSCQPEDMDTIGILQSLGVRKAVPLRLKRDVDERAMCHAFSSEDEVTERASIFA